MLIGLMDKPESFGFIEIQLPENARRSSENKREVLVFFQLVLSLSIQKITLLDKQANLNLLIGIVYCDCLLDLSVEHLGSLWSMRC